MRPKHCTTNWMISGLRMIFWGHICREFIRRILTESEKSRVWRDYKGETVLWTAPWRLILRKFIELVTRSNQDRVSAVKHSHTSQTNPTPHPSTNTVHNRSPPCSRQFLWRTSNYPNSLTNPNTCTTPSYTYNRRTNNWRDNTLSCRLSSRPSQSRTSPTRSKLKSWGIWSMRKGNCGIERKIKSWLRSRMILWLRKRFRDSLGKIIGSFKGWGCWKRRRTPSMLS